MRFITQRICMLIVLLALIFQSQPAHAQTIDAWCYTHPNEVKFHRLINEYRKAHGLQPVALSRSLGWAAADRAAYMARTDDVDHTQGTRSWSDVIWFYGYPTGYAIGENVLAGRQSAGGALNLWISSPAHKANMLNPAWKAIGIGRRVNFNGVYDYYWATEFGAVRHRTISC